MEYITPVVPESRELSNLGVQGCGNQGTCSGK
jgi:hypothetical protein